MRADELKSGLTTQAFGKHIYHFNVIDSTNVEAARLLEKSSLEHGDIIVADRQTLGKGSSGNTWESNSHEGLWMSLVLKGALRKSPLSFIPAICLRNTLSSYGIDAHLKWPNDVLIGDKKVAGILCESQIGNSHNDNAWIVGVGVNINQVSFPDSLKNKAISLKILTGRDFSIEVFFQHFVNELDRFYNSEEDVVACWKQGTKMIGKTIMATRSGSKIKVTVTGVSAGGHLRVLKEDGAHEQWISSSDLDIMQAY